MPFRPRSTPRERVALYHSAEWRRTRRALLDAHPYCVGCGALATVADHIIPLRYGGTALQPMCARCHQVKRATTDQGYPLRPRGVVGIGVTPDQTPEASP